MNGDTANKPIVVGIDGSRYSREALRWALGAAAVRGCPVQALMVWHTEPVIAAGRPTIIGVGTMMSGESGPEEYVRLLETVVHGVLDGHDEPRLDATLVRGSPPEVLAAASADAQLLVLGSHGHGRVLDAVLGTVSQYCVRHAHCPVVVIPAQVAREHPEEGGTRVEPGLLSSLSSGLGPLL